jgi:2'-5' RNA ligase
MGRHGDEEKEGPTQEIPVSPRLLVSVSRLFCAIELPAEVRSRVGEHIARLRDAVPSAHASWSREGNMHLTLKFLGEIPQTRVDNLSLAASRAVAELSTFKLVVEGAGCFPKAGSPRVLWIGVNDPSGKLTELHGLLEAECAKEGFAKEQRTFHPHFTLARLRQPQGARALASAHKQIGFDPIKISVSELLVIRSELSSGGSKYTIVSRHLLTGSAGETSALPVITLATGGAVEEDCPLNVSGQFQQTLP